MHILTLYCWLAESTHCCIASTLHSSSHSVYTAICNNHLLVIPFAVLLLLCDLNSYILLIHTLWCSYAWSLILHRLTKTSSTGNIGTSNTNTNTPNDSSAPATSTSVHTTNGNNNAQQQQQQHSSASTTHDGIDTQISHYDSNVHESDTPLTVEKQERSFLKKLANQPKRAIQSISQLVCTCCVMLYIAFQLQRIA
jgi:hypothetical protein